MRPIRILAIVCCLFGAPLVAETPMLVPPELLPLARDAKELFERGNYLEAEKDYEKILAAAPRNLYAQSNLGAALFRMGRYKEAEGAFHRVIEVAPTDAFSHCTLGIIFYFQGKYDAAVTEFNTAIPLEPNNATAHNYLGLTMSQKGSPQIAERELEKAVAADERYADAFFNLAVVLATKRPPNTEEARKQYQRALELGEERDPALERAMNYDAADRPSRPAAPCGDSIPEPVRTCSAW